MANQRICSIDGCGKQYYCRGYCASHARRLRKYGDPLAGRAPNGEPQRFYRNVVLKYEGNECLIWPFNRSGAGYGYMMIGAKNAVVSREVCEEINGHPPSPDYEASHICGRGHEGCVTKGHIKWKTRAENQADKIIHGTSRRGEKQSLSKLTEKQVLEIRALRGKETQSTIAKIYGVSAGAIAAIYVGKSWGWLK